MTLSQISSCGFTIFVRNLCRKSASTIYTMYKKSWIMFLLKIWREQNYLCFFFGGEYLISWGEKTENQLGFLNDYSLSCQKLWGPKRQSTQVFLEIFWVPFCTPLVLFLPFFDSWGLKKRSNSHLWCPKWRWLQILSKNIIQDFLYRVYMVDADFRQKFLTKIVNPQLEFWLKVK